MPRWSAERRAPYVIGRETPRQVSLRVPRYGTLRCGDPHQRLSALRSLVREGRQEGAARCASRSGTTNRDGGALTKPFRVARMSAATCGSCMGGRPRMSLPLIRATCFTLRDAHTSIATGCSTMPLNTASNCAPSAPSITR
jgi:hypothetical protein